MFVANNQCKIKNEYSAGGRFCSWIHPCIVLQIYADSLYCLQIQSALLSYPAYKVDAVVLYLIIYQDYPSSQHTQHVIHYPSIAELRDKFPVSSFGDFDEIYWHRFRQEVFDECTLKHICKHLQDLKKKKQEILERHLKVVQVLLN